MTSPRRLLNYWQLHPKRQLGQNFLIDPSTADMIVSRSKINPGDIVLEIGAGLGALTIPLSRAASSVYAIEIDQSLTLLLKAELDSHGIENVTIMGHNILRTDIHEIMEMAGSKLIVFGNLPYNISSQVLVHLIKSRSALKRAILMFQKELARRISADPGIKDYGRISAMLQSCADIKSIAEVKASQFFPRPKIDSEVLEIIFNNWMDQFVKEEDLFFNVIKAAFSKRRKTLKNALGTSAYFQDAKDAARVLSSIGIDPTRRAETLTKEEFAMLSNAAYEMRK
ncbi:MAG TPA: ribosomal RNA small subunit methyltransferase A [Deltaproteobacteria bacterium]|nr:ribosomal RNA small subunit methyltransferase A [Deltaproteobacteria bacterium]